MHKKYLIKSLWLIALWFGHLINCKAQAKITLEQAWILALKYPEIERAGLLIKNAKIQLEISALKLRPSINAQFTNPWNIGKSIDPYSNSFSTKSILGGNYQISATYPIFDGGQIKTNIEQNKLLVAISDYEYKNIENDIKFKTLQAFVNVMFAREQLKLIESQIKAISEKIQYSNKLLKAERLRFVVVKALEAEQLKFQIDLASAQTNLEISKLKLAAFIGMNSKQKFELADVPIVINSDAEQNLSEIKFNTLPEIRALKLREEVKKLDSKIFFASRLPVVTINSNLNSTFSSIAKEIKNNELVKINYPNQIIQNFNYGIGIILKTPIYNITNYKINIKKAEVATKVAELDIVIKKKEFQELLDNAILNRQKIINQFELQSQQIQVLNEVHQITSVGFFEGRVELAEYLQNKRSLDEAIIQNLRLKYEYFMQDKIVSFYKSGNWQ